MEQERTEIVFFRDGEGRTFQTDQYGKTLQYCGNCGAFKRLRETDSQRNAAYADRKFSGYKKILYIVEENL